MSRATHIWTVFDWSGALLGAFTVKHEMATALSTREDREQLTVVRVGDGHLGGQARFVELDPLTLKEKA